MGIMDSLTRIFPSVAEPQGHLSFRSRLKWTAVVLLLFLVLGQILLYGVSQTSRQQFQFYEVILGSSIGSILTLGIGPIVTASIILQLIVGSGILPWNLKTHEGRKKFQGTQKLLVIFFAVFEGIAYVAFGAIQPVSSDPTVYAIVIGQLVMGAVLVLFMDEVVSKWGIGSGVSLFIAAGVCRQIFIRAFNPITPAGSTVPAGLIPQFITYMGIGELFQAFVAILPIISTIIVFLVVVYAQSLKIEIPIALGSIRGFARRWPLNLLYTSNIPVILVAALLANLQLLGSITTSVNSQGLKCGFLGCFDVQTGQPNSGIVLYFFAPSSLSVQVFFTLFLAIVFAIAFVSFYLKAANLRTVGIAALVGFVVALAGANMIAGLPTPEEISRIIAYLLILTLGSMVFSVFWVSTSGMDARSVAEQIEGMGMQIPGFRRDPRIVEEVLNRYIPTLTLISGLMIGALAALGDFTHALGSGTGILLTVMIIYNMYESIAARYMEDMHPAMRKFFR